MVISSKVRAAIERASWIRKMFEEGARMKAEKGAQNVYDFSLGNPNLPPPPVFVETLKRLIDEETPGIHGYMPNAGYPDVREAVARKVSREQGVELGWQNVIMTVGAGGALNTVFRAVLEQGDEILVPRPYFVEYGFYAENHGASLVSAPTNEDFSLNLAALEAAINAKTRVVLINSPNNPTGAVYPEADLLALGEILRRKSAELGRVIYLLSDEPYRALIYDGVELPAVFKVYEASVICTSFSKDLSLPGERIGFIAVNPKFGGAKELIDALTFTIRVLGFVNAPALMQRVVKYMLDETVDVGFYKANRDLFVEALTRYGYKIQKPAGAFYLFVKSPIEDDVAFAKELLKENIIAVPGVGFMGPGHIRLAYCCDRAVIEKSLPGFERAIKKVLGNLKVG